MTRRNVHQPTVPVPTYHLVNAALSVHHRRLFNQAMKSGEDQPRDQVHQEELVHRDRRVGLDPKGDQDLLDLLDLNPILHLFLDKSLSKEEKRVPHQTPFPTCKHRLVLLDQEDLQVCEVHPALRDSWVPKVTMGTLDHQAPLDHRE